MNSTLETMLHGACAWISCAALATIIDDHIQQATVETVLLMCFVAIVVYTIIKLLHINKKQVVI